MSESNIYYYGIAQNLPSSKTLRAGNLRMMYENGFLRYIKIGNSEILRMIYFAVRDHNWDTIDGTVQNEILEIEDDHFSIRYHSIHKKGGIKITFRCLLTGDKNGHIMFSIEGEAGSTFMKNSSMIFLSSIFLILARTAPPEIPNSIPICLSDSLQLFNNLPRIFISKLSIISPIVPQ